MVDLDTKRPVEFSSQVELTERIFNFLSVSPASKKDREGANVILLMGGNNHEASSKKAYELWKEDPSRVIVATTKSGKFSPENAHSISEAEDYLNMLRKLRNEDSGETWELKVICEPISKNTIDELENLPKVLKKHNIRSKKALMVDVPVHQMRAKANARKLLPGIEIINCPNDSRFDTTNVQNQLRVVEELERLIVYEDLETPRVPLSVLRAYRRLKEILVEKGVYVDSQHNPESLYKMKEPHRFRRRSGDRDFIK